MGYFVQFGALALLVVAISGVVVVFFWGFLLAHHKHSPEKSVLRAMIVGFVAFVVWIALIALLVALGVLILAVETTAALAPVVTVVPVRQERG